MDNNKFYLVAADMGYGHQRAAYPLLEMSQGGIINLNDYLEIITNEGLVNKGLPKVFLIPHIFDKYVLDVNIENKKISVKDSLIILENS